MSDSENSIYSSSKLTKLKALHIEDLDLVTTAMFTEVSLLLFLQPLRLFSEKLRGLHVPVSFAVSQHL